MRITTNLHYWRMRNTIVATAILAEYKHVSVVAGLPVTTAASNPDKKTDSKGGKVMQQQPIMTTIGNRPAKVTHLHSIDGTYVQCKLPNGEEAWVPLREVSDLIQEDLLSRFPKYEGKYE